MDSSLDNTAGLVVTFTREVRLQSSPIQALLHFSADTRYKLIINGARVAVGPVRSSPLIWYYDTLDIAPHLRQGHNVIQFLVIRYFAATRAAMPFERTLYPGLTVCGNVHSEDETIDISSSDEWRAEVDEGRLFPIGLIDDGFLHVGSPPPMINILMYEMLCRSVSASGPLARIHHPTWYYTTSTQKMGTCCHGV